MAQWVVHAAGGMSRKGRWQPAAKTVLLTLAGGMDLDLTEAQLAPGVTTLTKVSLVGGVDVTVPPTVRVEASNFSLAGSVGEDEAPAGVALGKDAPTLRIRAFSLAGGVRIRRSAG